jgi:hypothetical protein
MIFMGNLLGNALTGKGKRRNSVHPAAESHSSAENGPKSASTAEILNPEVERKLVETCGLYICEPARQLLSTSSHGELRRVTMVFAKAAQSITAFLSPDHGLALAQEAFGIAWTTAREYEGALIDFFADEKGVVFLLAFGLPPRKYRHRHGLRERMTGTVGLILFYFFSFNIFSSQILTSEKASLLCGQRFKFQSSLVNYIAVKIMGSRFRYLSASRRAAALRVSWDRICAQLIRSTELLPSWPHASQGSLHRASSVS